MSEKFYEDRAMRAGPIEAPAPKPEPAAPKPATHRMKRDGSGARLAGRRVRPGDDVSDIYSSLAPEDQARCEAYTPHVAATPELRRKVRLERLGAAPEGAQKGKV
jgi:hypothetical protein